jgi:aryl-alcohol dehydrogenase-like predicted oxidoreductase
MVKMLATAPFGRTGHASSRVIFGAAALSRVSQDVADEILPLLETYGVNHIDTAAAYGDSELRLAPWLEGRRNEFFVATKTSERRADAARASLERSLERLGADHVDLIQLHNLVEDDELDAVHERDGALAGLLRARDEGLVRYIGVTGHGTRIARAHLHSLERFDFDSVLLPYNFLMLQHESYRDDVEALLEVCADRNVAVQTIKSIARRRWPERTDAKERRGWYEPLADADAISRAVRFVLAKPQLFLNSPSDFTLLGEVLAAASAPSFEAPSEAEMQRDADVFAMRALFDGAGLERI